MGWLQLFTWPKRASNRSYSSAALQAGGAAITEEFSPGFRCSTLAHSAGPLLPEIVSDMQLARHGLKLVTPDIAVTALSPDGRALVLYNDAVRAAQEISKFSAKDAERYPVFQQSSGENWPRYQ